MFWNGSMLLYAPDDAGGGGEPEKPVDQPEQPGLPDGLVDFLRKRKVDPENLHQVLGAIWESRGDEIRGRQEERRTRQKLEEQLKKVDFGKMFGIEQVNEDTVAELQKKVSLGSQTETVMAALQLVAEAELSLSPELMKVVAAGPEATAAVIAMLQRTKTTANAPGTPSAEDVARILAAKMGIGADLSQPKPASGTPPEKGGVLARLRGEKPQAQSFIDRLKASAESQTK